MIIGPELELPVAESTTLTERTIALLPWGDVWEDFFLTVGVDFETFCTEVTGGWQGGYIEALKQFGFRTILIYFSTLVKKPQRFVHKPTGAKICMLPLPWGYRVIRRYMVHPYPSLGYWGTLEDLFGPVQGARRKLFSALKEIGPYLSTPLWLLARELRRERCAAILCQEYEYFRFDLCVLLGRLIRLPVFATFQGGTYDCNRIGRYLRPMTMPYCRGFMIGPQAEINRVCNSYKIKTSQIAQIFNPVDLRMWDGADRNKGRALYKVPDDAVVVIWHGRVDVHNKGLDILMDAWQNLCAERPGRDLRLFLLGAAEDSEKLRLRIAAMRLLNVMWIDKYVNDRTLMRDFLSAGDVYSFPSRWEGFPVAPLEAMACGLPVVATEAAGVRDIFENGEDSGGIVVPLEDTAAFAQALGRMVDNEDLRKQMGKSARRRIEEFFSMENVGRKMSQFLNRLIR